MRTMFGAVVVVIGCAAALAGQTPVQTPPARVIPVGSQFNVVLQKPLDSATAKVDDRFDTGAIEDWTVQGQVVVEIGTTIRGFVSSVRPSNRPVQNREAKGMGQLTLSFNEIVFGERTMKLRASVVAVLDPRRRQDDTRRASTANVVGGSDTLGLPAFTDVVVSAGSIVPVGTGEAKLPVGVVLRIRIDQPLEFR
jgi:hypothetical protein